MEVKATGLHQGNLQLLLGAALGNLVGLKKNIHTDIVKVKMFFGRKWPLGGRGEKGL